MNAIRRRWHEFYARHILTRPCPGRCGDPSPHDAHLTRYGARRLARTSESWPT